MAAKAEKVFFYRPELQWAQDTVTATSIITPESIVAGAIGILAGAIDRRNQAADRLVETNRQKDVALCEAAAVIDARRFIDSNDLDNLFGLKKGDSCFGFLRECVSEIILSAAQKGRRFGGVLDRFAERLGVDKSIIEEAACGLQERENRSFMRESRGSHEQQA
jgi:hypothetical protein